MNFNNCGVIVPDVSFWQDDNSTPNGIDFAKMKAAGVAGVIIRAGQNSWLDPDFKTNWQAAKEAGLSRGSYWFYDSRTEPAKQANQWHAALAGDMPELGLWSDLEESYGGLYAGERNWKRFVLSVGVYFPSVQPHGIYTADWWWKQQSVSDPAFWSTYPLWVAQYGVNQSDVAIPKPWQGKVEGPLFWQFTASGDGGRFGVESKEIDLNYWNGTKESFRQYFKLGGEVIPPQEEGQTMYRYEATSIYRMSLRPSQNVDNTPITTIAAQSKMEGNWLLGEPGSGEVWLQVSAVNGVALPASGWVAIEHASRVYCTLKDVNPPVPPEPTFPPRWGLTQDGVTIKWYVPE